MPRRSSKRGRGRGRGRTSKYGPPVTGGSHVTVWNKFEHVYERLKKKMSTRKAASIANAMIHKGYKSHKGMKKAMKRHSAKRGRKKR